MRFANIRIFEFSGIRWPRSVLRGGFGGLRMSFAWPEVWNGCCGWVGVFGGCGVLEREVATIASELMLSIFKRNFAPKPICDSFAITFGNVRTIEWYWCVCGSRGRLLSDCDDTPHSKPNPTPPPHLPERYLFEDRLPRLQ